MKNLFSEDFINIEKSNSRLKYQEDCHVPAIGKMSGCITTDILLPIHSELVGSYTERLKEFKNMKMIDDERAKQPNQVASFALDP
jgi:hypothetical protein